MDRLDPRTKIMMMACLSGVAMMTDNIFFLLGLSLSLPLLLWVGGIRFLRQRKQLAGMVGLVAFLFVIQALFGRFYEGGAMALRLLIILLAALILLTGKPEDYLLALTRMGLPYEMAYMVMLGFHFFPLLKEEAGDVYYSIQLRGTELKKASIPAKLSAYRRISIPILTGALERAEDTSIAMEARGFRSQKRRTYLKKLKLKKRDVLLLILTPLLAATFLFFANRDGGDEDMGREVILTYVDEDTVAISWGDMQKYDGFVIWEGEEISAHRQEIREDQYYKYTVEIADLERGREYEYRMSDGERNSLKREFSLPKKGGTFLYMGDIQYMSRERDYLIWGELLEEARKKTGDGEVLLLGGDMVEKGPDLADWSTFLSAGQPTFSQMPVMTTPGNHETSILPATYLDMMTLPENSPLPEEVYSFQLGDVYFLSLNSCLFMEERKSQEGYEETMEAVNRWIGEELKENKAKWKIVFFHHPMYPVIEDVPLYEEMRNAWEQTLADGEVSLVLCGHQHVYMRTEPMKGITHIMCNSGEKESNYLGEGEELPEYVAKMEAEGAVYLRIYVEDDYLKVEAYKKGGEQVDSCEIAEK